MLKRCIILLQIFSYLLVNTLIQAQSIDHWESVVYAEDTWNYFVGMTSGPPTGWQNKGFDVSSWLPGKGGFGYGDGDDSTEIPVPPYPTSIFVRTGFSIADTSQIALAILNMDFDDGFVAWINGIEVARSNLGTVGDYPSYNTPAVGHEALMWQGKVPPSFFIIKQKLKSCLVNGNNVLAVQVNNINSTSTDMSCIPYLSVGMKTADLAYRPVPSWFIDPYTDFNGSHLPLIVVETNGAVIQPNVKVKVDLGIIDKGPGELNFPDDERNEYNGPAGIEYRGSSSMSFPKKNYGFETWTPEGIDTAYSLLGMPLEIDWVLHGPYSDKSLIRNFLAYNLARRMGHYAPRTEFCELFVDWQYKGLYVLLEKIKRDTNRVDIADLDTNDVYGHDLTGGYIVKIDRSADGSYTDGWYSPYAGTGTGGGSPFFAYHYPRHDEIVQVQKDYIRTKISSFESALYSPEYLDPITGYRHFIDVNSFIDYFILVEMSKNTDGFRLSTFLYKDRDDRDPRIHMGPVWDYDLAFGNANYLEASKTYGWNYSVVSDGWGTPFWWSKMLTDPQFANSLNCRWKTLRQGVLSDEALMVYIDSLVTEVGMASDRNFLQWPIHGQYIWPNPYVGNTYEEDIIYMKNWILDRTAWIDANIPGVNCVLSVDDDLENTSFMLMAKPNPGIGFVHLEIQNPSQQKLFVKITSVTGQIAFEATVEHLQVYAREIKLQPGMYIISVIGENELKTCKVIIL